MSSTKTPKRRLQPRSSTLLLIAGLMLTSAVIRISLEAGPAFAKGTSDEAMQAETQPENTPGTRTSSAEFQHLLTLFQERERALEMREKEFEDRRIALEIADEALERKLAALTEAEQKLRKTLALADVAAEDDLTRLTEVYEKMKPKESAALFEEMDSRFAAGFLARMRPEAAAQIMAGLSPTVAYTISVVLAGRNASVPKN